ncbi:hypothetical protein tb265_44650 [Gemmatimonadetes bacterium T265]|nr:hypothetical protein tb265_44650 [Gemmatimonadetes bacterium T265]
MPICRPVLLSRALPRLALALLCAACRESATAPLGPSRTVTDAAPSGIVVVSARSPWKYDADLRAASATVAGDSVVLTYVAGDGCGQTFAPSAGMVHGVLVVTDVGRTPAGVEGCLAVAYSGGVLVRLSVRPPAHGRLAVVLRERTESVPAGGGFAERDVLQRTVTLP